MTTINQLSSTDAIVGGDLLLVWSTTNSDSRKASVNVLLDYIQDNFVLNSVAGADKALQFNNASVLGGASSVKVIAAGTGLNFTGVAQPAAAAATGVNLFSTNELGGAILSVRDGFATETFLQESMAHRATVIFTPFSTTAHASLGMSTDDAGTVSGASNSTIGAYWNHATAATANTDASCGGAITNLFGTLGYYYCSTLLFPDAGYGSGSTGTRFAAGVVSSAKTNAVSSDTFASAGAGFRYSTNANDTNFMFVGNNGTSTATQDTGMVFAINKLYQFEMYCPPNGATIYWRIKNLTDNLVRTGNTTSVPPSATGLFFHAGLRTLTTTSRNLQFKRVYVQSFT
jgi:hypothetical protein